MIVALNTGLRLGELIGLTWERVDLSRGVIRLELTKSGRRREVPMNDASYRALVGLDPKGLRPGLQDSLHQDRLNNAVEAANLTTLHSIPSGPRSHCGRSCGGYAAAGATWPVLPGHDDAVRPPCPGAPPHGG